MSGTQRKPKKSTASRRAGSQTGSKASPNDESEDALGPASFEGALDQLERTVTRLETGEMPLEEALEVFESGVKLSRQCNETLEAAERRIEILVADRGGASEVEGFDYTLQDTSEEDTDEFDDEEPEE